MTMPVAASVESLPRLVYQGQPVITTEFLAGMYGVQTQNIHDNFRKNQDRFVPGKHFIKLEGKELKALRDYPESFRSVIPARTRHLVLWTARGSARHAKMLNTDTAWDVYERMEDGYFELLEQKAAQPTPKPAPANLVTSTPADRAPLRSLCAVLARKIAAPGRPTQDHHRSVSQQLKANFQLDTIKQLPLAWIPDATAWLQDRIDAIQTALPAPEPIKQAMLPMEPANADVSQCMEKLRMAKSILREESDRLFRLIKTRINSRAGAAGPAAFSMLVNMDYANEEIAYGLDRQLNALEYIAMAGLLTSEAMPARR